MNGVDLPYGTLDLAVNMYPLMLLEIRRALGTACKGKQRHQISVIEFAPEHCPGTLMSGCSPATSVAVTKGTRFSQDLS